MSNLPVDSLADLGARINEAHHLAIQHAGKAIELATLQNFTCATPARKRQPLICR
jgi:hypothetical protein